MIKILLSKDPPSFVHGECDRHAQAQQHELKIFIAKLSSRNRYGFALILLCNMFCKFICCSWRYCIRGYSQEIEWRDEHYVPETIDKHLEISRVIVGAFQLACSSFVGMGNIITKEVLDWLLTYPELLKCFTTFVRLSNDITSTEVFLYLDTSLCIFYTLQYQQI